MNKRNISGQAIEFLFCANKVMLEDHSPCIFHENTMPLLKIIFVKLSDAFNVSENSVYLLKVLKLTFYLRIFSVISTN